MLNIKVAGPGCANCEKLYNLCREVIEENNIPATITKVTDMNQIAELTGDQRRGQIERQNPDQAYVAALAAGCTVKTLRGDPRRFHREPRRQIVICFPCNSVPPQWPSVSFLFINNKENL